VGQSFVSNERMFATAVGSPGCSPTLSRCRCRGPSHKRFEPAQSNNRRMKQGTCGRRSRDWHWPEGAGSMMLTGGDSPSGSTRRCRPCSTDLVIGPGCHPPFLFASRQTRIKSAPGRLIGLCAASSCTTTVEKLIPEIIDARISQFDDEHRMRRVDISRKLRTELGPCTGVLNDPLRSLSKGRQAV